MMIYLILGEESTERELAALIEKAYPEEEKRLKMSGPQWLVRDEGKSGKDVWHRIVGDEQPDPPVSVVIPFNNYYGIHYSYVWDWKKGQR